MTWTVRLPRDVEIAGTIGTRLLPDKTLVVLTPLLFGDMQVSIAPPHPATGEVDTSGWSQAYQFDSRHVAHAMWAFLSYDPDLPEPEGWCRHIPSNRRRPDGEASLEHVDP